MNNFTGNRYTQGFHGCIHVVEVSERNLYFIRMSGDGNFRLNQLQGHEDKAIDLGRNVVSGLNVDQCPE